MRPQLPPRLDAGQTPGTGPAYPTGRGVRSGRLTREWRPERWMAAATLAMAVLAVSALPLRQLLDTGGFVFFTNAFDEATYLQYHVSRSLQGVARPSQALVTALHEAGLSGGWINWLLDLVCLTGFAWLARRCLLAAQLRPAEATLGGMLLLLLPVWFGGANPVERRLFALNLDRGLIYWVTLPEADFLPILRSPEPQLSLLVLGAALLLALRLRSHLPLYAVAPFLYAYVAVPVLFAVLAHHLAGRLPRARWAPWAAAGASFLAVGFGLTLYSRLLMTAEARDMFVATRLPLLSGTGVVGLGVYLLFRDAIRPAHRLPVLLAVCAPLAAANLQLVSGWMAQPNGTEQYFGVMTAALPMCLALGRRERLARATLLLALGLFLAREAANFRAQPTADRLDLTPQRLAVLRTHSERVAIDDVRLASLASLLFPRQPSTLFAYQRTYRGSAHSSFADYQCAKARLRADPRLGRRFDEVFRTLDRAYEFESQDFILLHVGRRRSFTRRHPVEAMPERCPPRPLHPLLVRDLPSHAPPSSR